MSLIILRIQVGLSFFFSRSSPQLLRFADAFSLWFKPRFHNFLEFPACGALAAQPFSSTYLQSETAQEPKILRKYVTVNLPRRAVFFYFVYLCLSSQARGPFPEALRDVGSAAHRFRRASAQKISKSTRRGLRVFPVRFFQTLGLVHSLPLGQTGRGVAPRVSVATWRLLCR